MLETPEKDFGLMSLRKTGGMFSGMCNISMAVCSKYFLDSLIADVRKNNILKKEDNKDLGEVYELMKKVSVGRLFFDVAGNPDGSFGNTNVAKVKDATASRKLVHKSCMLYKNSDLKNISPHAPVQVDKVALKENARTSDKTPVDILTVDLKYKEGPVKAAAQKMYGNQIKYEFTYPDDYLVWTVGKDPSEMTDAALQSLSAGKMKPVSGLPAKGLFLVTLNPLNFTKWIANIAPGPQRGQMVMMFAVAKGLLQSINSTAVITLTGKKQGDKLVVREHIPYAPFQKIYETFSGMMSRPAPPRSSQPQ